MSPIFGNLRDLSGLPLQCGRAAVAGTLCALLVGQPILAEAAVKKTAAAPKILQLRGQERVLQALNRLTFGPTPGEAAAVEKMGLDKWFEQQLNPSSIDDSALEARLAEYPAMNLPLAELQRKFPGPQMLRAIAEGKQAMPADPIQRAMVEDQVKFYKLQRKAQAAAAGAQQAHGAPDMAANAAIGMGGDMAAPTPAGKGKKAQAADAMGAEAGMAPDKPLAASEVAPDAAMVPANEGGAPPVDRAAMREQAMKLAQLPPDDRFKAIMALSPNQLQQMRGALNAGNPAGVALLAGFTPEQKEMLTALQGGVRMIALEAMESRLLRDIYSQRQLEAVMTDFWLNHFNVYVRKNQNEAYLLPAYERETIRPNALGKFEDLLVATAKSPAMLEYLDNFRSVGPDSVQATRLKRAKQLNPNGPLLKQAAAGLNENYGRELMELHTLGVNGGYTQADVTMVSKVFTGWGIDQPYQGGLFQFNERRHEPGPKTVLGKTIQENGEQEGLEVLHMLATSPATAHFISKKLAVRFVSDDPPTALVDRMAASFLKSDGDIKTVLRTMFDSPEFWSTTAYRAKVKTPEEFVVSAVRASGARVNNPQALVQSLDKLGMPIYGMQTPNGYSWTEEGWVSTGALVSRMNFALVLADDRLPGVRMDWAGLLGDKPAALVPASYDKAAPADPIAAKEKRLELVLLGQPVSERTRATVLAQSTDANVTAQAQAQFDLGNGGKGKGYAPRGMRAGLSPNAGPDDPQGAVMAGLLLGSPEFQRR
jgi:uncharacterized protein (DUF1800 family)